MILPRLLFCATTLLAASAAEAQMEPVEVWGVDPDALLAALPDTMDFGPPLGIVALSVRRARQEHTHIAASLASADRAVEFGVRLPFNPLSAPTAYGYTPSGDPELADQIRRRGIAQIDLDSLRRALPQKRFAWDLHQLEVRDPEEVWLRPAARLVETSRPSQLLGWLPDEVGRWRATTASASWRVGRVHHVGGAEPQTSVSRCYSDVHPVLPTSMRTAHLGAIWRQRAIYCGLTREPPDAEKPLCVTVSAGPAQTDSTNGIAAWSAPRSGVTSGGGALVVRAYSPTATLSMQTPSATVVLEGPSSQRPRIEDLLRLLTESPRPQADVTGVPDGLPVDDGTHLVVRSDQAETPFALRFVRPRGLRWNTRVQLEGLRSWLVLSDADPVALSTASPMVSVEGIVIGIGQRLTPVDVLEGAPALRWQLFGISGYRDYDFVMDEAPRRLHLDGFVAAATASFRFHLGGSPERWGRLVGLARQGADTVTILVVAPPDRQADAERMVSDLLQSLSVVLL